MSSRLRLAAEGLRGPWRAVAVLGVTQILAWGTIYYTPVLMVPRIAAAHDWSASMTMAGFSLGILAAGLVAPRVGSLIDRHGGHAVMPFGSLCGAAGLAAMPFASVPAAYFAVWLLLGIAMAMSLYDPAFATLGRIFGRSARQPITVLTLAGAFASTVSWPATAALLDLIGWRHTYFVYAALMAFIAAPLHAFALPRTRVEAETATDESGTPAPALLAPAGLPFFLVVAAFAIYAAVPSGLLANLLAMFERLGLAPAAAVAIGALFGPCQMAARLCEFLFAREAHPLNVARFAVGMLGLGFLLLWAFGLAAAVAGAFMMLLGLCNGLITIARGTVPLALFGASGYGRLIGRIAGPALVIQSVAPLALAAIAERASDSVALAFAGVLVGIAFACFVAIPRPAR